MLDPDLTQHIGQSTEQTSNLGMVRGKSSGRFFEPSDHTLIGCRNFVFAQQSVDILVEVFEQRLEFRIDTLRRTQLLVKLIENTFDLFGRHEASQILAR